MASKSNIFNFKEFSIQQSKSAMKVGTDAMILGAWTDISAAQTILDIGTGTGILGLMMAQRSDALTIDAVEIDENAFEEAVENFENAIWADRLYCYHASIQEFVDEIDEKYDLIICNPPYFSPTRIESFSGRKVARETHLLNHLTLLKSTKKLLSKKGICSFSLPTESESFFIDLAVKLGFKLQRRLRMKDKENTKFIRCFLQFGFNEIPLEEQILILKNEENTYTQQFVQLTKDFYTIF